MLVDYEGVKSGKLEERICSILSSHFSLPFSGNL
jgi:hypothetical protein